MRSRASFAVLASAMLAVFVAAVSMAQERRGIDPQIGDSSQTTEKAPIHRAGKLIGRGVRGIGGEDLGEIEEFVITEKGMVAYAVLSYGGILGIGEKLVAVPWPLLKFVPKDRSFSLLATRAEIEKAPAVDMTKLPSVAPPFDGAPSGKAGEESRGSERGKLRGGEGSPPSGRPPAPTGRGPFPDPAPDPLEASAQFELLRGTRGPAERANEPKEAQKGSLPLTLKSGVKMAFVSAGAVERRGVTGRYDLTVHGATANGETTLLLSIDRSATPPTGANSQYIDPTRGRGGDEPRTTEGERTEKGPTTLTVRLGPDGLVKKGAQTLLIPREAEPHLRLIFGSGLHKEVLEPGKMLALAPLYEESKSETDQANEVRLRFEQIKEIGSSRIARFSILARGGLVPLPRGAQSGPQTRGASQEDKPPTGSGAGKGEPAADSEWRSVGEAVYRMEDGILEKVHFGGSSPPALFGVTSIQRMASSR